MKKRLLAILLTVALVLGMMPAAAFAADTGASEDYELKVLDFEGDYWDELIDEPQQQGPLLYGKEGTNNGYASEEEAYQWTDEETQLHHVLPYNWGTYCYVGGGHAVSNYATANYSLYGDYMNQLTVYDAGAGDKIARTGGGHSGNNFVMHFGYIDGSPYNLTEELPTLSFSDGEARVIDHMYVNMSVYALKCLLNGNELTEPGGTFWVKAIGFNGEERTGEVVMALSNGESSMITEWTKWDLSELGEVTAVQFNVGGSADNGYGFSQPSYFAYDDVAVRFPVESSSAPETPAAGTSWDGTTLTEPAQADGVYQIGSGAELAWFAQEAAASSKAVLTADIDLGEKTWTGKSAFSGSFDGQNHTIKNLNGSNGLFVSVIGTSDSARAEVKNVTVEGTVSGGTNVGGIAGTAYYANFTGCINKANVTGTSSYVAGIVAMPSQRVSSKIGHVTVTNCGNEGNISGTQYVGGIFGYAQTNVMLESCYNTGAIFASQATSNAGGIGGYAQGYGTNCNQTNCYNTGSVSGSQYVGGILGNMYNGVTATNCYNTGLISGTSGKIGAIAGQAYNNTTSIATNCYYLDTSCAVAATNKTSKISAASKSDADMKAADFVSSLGKAYKANNGGYPVLGWQTVSAGTVSYNVTEPTGDGFTFEGGAMAYSTEAYNFTVTINDYYRAGSNFAVKVNDTPVKEASAEGKVYSYSIAKPDADLVITVEGVESTAVTIYSGSGLPSSTNFVSRINIYDVDVTDITADGTDITVTLAEGTDLSAPIRFLVIPGGVSPDVLSVAPVKDFTKNLGMGILEQSIVATSIEGKVTTWNIKIQVDGAAVEYVDVKVPTSEMYTVTGPEKAVKGGNYSFSVKIAKRYIASDDFKVKANGKELTLTNGEYIVSNVTDDIEITVEGVVLRTFSSLAIGDTILTEEDYELKGHYDITYGAFGSSETYTSYDVPYYHVTVPYGTQTVKVTYPSYFKPVSSGLMSGTVGWSYNPITITKGVPVKGTITTHGDQAYVTNTDGSYTVTLNVSTYALNESGTGKGFTLFNDAEYAGVISFEVLPCAHMDTTTDYTRVDGEENHMKSVTCNTCSQPVGTAEKLQCVDNDNNGVCDLCKESVTVPVISVTLDQETASVEKGQTLTLNAVVEPGNATNSTVTWTSSDPDVATVEDGVVTAVKVGTATITASAGGKSDTCEVTVTAPITNLFFWPKDQTELSIKEGLTADVVACCSPIDTTDNIVEFTSGDETVFSVDKAEAAADQYGHAKIKVIAKKAGTAVLTAISKADDTIKAVLTIKVEEDAAAAAALAQAKAAAKVEIEGYKNAADYRDAQKEELAAAIEAAKTAIEAAEDTDSVATAVTAAKTAMDAIKTDAQLKAEEDAAAAAALAQAKTAAKAEIEAYKNAADYRDAQKAELAAAIEAAKTAIEAAEDTDSVATAVTAAKTAMDAIKTDAQLKAEESNAGGFGGTFIPVAPADPLPPAKAEAADSVKNYVKAESYTEESAAEIRAILAQAEKDIEAAKTVEEVKAIEEAVKEKLDAVETVEEVIAKIEDTKFKVTSKKTTSKGKAAIKITWKAPAGMGLDGYDVFRSTKKNSGYGKKPIFTTTKNSYTNNKGLKAGKTYYYKVRGFKFVNGEKVYTEWSTKAWRTIK